jgi:hypothetical protein
VWQAVGAEGTGAGESEESGRVASSGSGGRRSGRPAPAAPGWALAAGTALALVIGALALQAAAGSALHTPRFGYGVTALVAVAVLAAGLTAVWFYRRRTPRRAYLGATGERLRLATLAVLATLTFAVPGALLVFGRISLHGSAFQAPTTPTPPAPRPPAAQSARPSQPARPVTHWHLDLMPLLIGLVVLAGAIILAAVVFFLYTLLRGPLAGAAAGGDLAPGQDEAAQEQDALADALLAGRSALAGDDARAAIIACYAAMEGSLAEAGIARLASDSPTDLLRRAVRRGAVDPVGSERLTDLFREARFSTHPMDTGQLAEARAALDAVTAALTAVAAAAAAATAAAQSSEPAGVAGAGPQNAGGAR